jgi:hypothetical protein
MSLEVFSHISSYLFTSHPSFYKIMKFNAVNFFKNFYWEQNLKMSRNGRCSYQLLFIRLPPSAFTVAAQV